jgi:hypothetical protein
MVSVKASSSAWASFLVVSALVATNSISSDLFISAIGRLVGGQLTNSVKPLPNGDLGSLNAKPALDIDAGFFGDYPAKLSPSL